MIQSMEPRVLTATDRGLWELQGPDFRRVEALVDRPVTALTTDGTRAWAIVDGRSLWQSGGDGGWNEVAPVVGPLATCLAPAADGLLIGTEEAHLLRLADGKLAPVESFETVEGRPAWYTPWGDPADARSIAVAADGAIHVNVHVGGVVRSRDRGRSWAPTVDIEADVHQVLAHPTRPDVVLVAAAIGFGVSHDGGDSWDFVKAGLHARYLRAVTVSDDAVLVSASTGPRGRRSALYRKPLDGTARFERCREGLPEWFDDNIDTACLAARGSVVIFGTEDGRVFRSRDAGARWELVAADVPPVRSIALG